VRSEVAALTAAGVAEIVLVAQDLAAYGRDIGEGIVELLEYVGEVEGLRRLRLLYLYPREITPRLIDTMASHPAVADYFDLSLQHVSGPLLRAMKRSGDGERHLELISRIRSAAPEAALRSSFIVGFPGETDDDVDRLEEFLVEARLDWAGFFAFSPESGTPAATLPGAAAEAEVAERLRRLQARQEELTAEASAAAVGRVVDVVVDQVEDGVPVGRSQREAPEIDGLVLLDRGGPGERHRAAAGSDRELERSRDRQASRRRRSGPLPSGRGRRQPGEGDRCGARRGRARRRADHHRRHRSDPRRHHP
jgi:MiaB/RimO family radical SAM methylthiotransferase